MLVAVAAALAWPGSPAVPRLGRVVSLAVVGRSLAAGFRPSVLPLIGRHSLPVGLVTCGTLFISLAVGLLLSRLDRRTAALGSLPGAASGVLAMSGPLGADPRLVAVMQYTRVVVVVFSAAAVSRFGLVPGTRLRLPAGALLGPLVLGLWVGLTFDRASVARAGRLLPVVVASSLGLVVACAGLGWMFAALTGIDGLTAYLAATPGGIDSIAVMALGSGADAPLLLAVQTLRLLAGALIGRWWA